MQYQTQLGISHFLTNTDTISKTLLCILLMMSIGCWFIIVVKTYASIKNKRLSKHFLTRFWNAPSIDSLLQDNNQVDTFEPFGQLTQQALKAKIHHDKYGATTLSDTGADQDFLTRTIKQNLDVQTAKLENGLTFLATVAATAPFVGLFGTVWGVYHALLVISETGSGTLDKIAGPVGEALIMTGFGLAVALPAVVAYNAFSRGNRVLLGRLDSFAFDLLSFLTMGKAMHHKPNHNITQGQS